MRVSLAPCDGSLHQHLAAAERLTTQWLHRVGRRRRRDSDARQLARSTNTTWGWNGQRWSLHLPPATPPDREGYQLVSNPLRNTVLLFGGRGINDTWEWDGVTWLERQPTTSPPGRGGFAMAFDERRGRAVVFGGERFGVGLLDDTWEWDGRTWLERQPAHRPPARQYHAMGWDPLRSRVLLFGGTNDPQFHNQLADTWEWDGTDWVQRSSGGVAPRAVHGMTWDPIGNVMLVFGGYTGDANNNSTVSWDGTAWTTRATPQPPPFSAGAILATDRRRNRAVMVNEGVWEWDGTVWVRRSEARSLSAQPMYFDTRVMQVATVAYSGMWHWSGTEWTSTNTYPVPTGYFHALGYDPVRQRAVQVSTNYFDGGTETSEFDGQSWLRVPTPTGLRAQSGYLVAETMWDPARQRLVLFDGYPDAGTWEWDGTSWETFPDAGGPPTRQFNGLAWDSKRNRAVLFGGRQGFTATNDTWERVGTQWVQQAVDAGPPVHFPATLAYDPVRERTLLLAPNSTTGASETWEWDGTSWVRLSPAVAPALPTASNPEYYGHLVFDPVSQRVLLLRDGTLWRFEP